MARSAQAKEDVVLETDGPRRASLAQERSRRTRHDLVKAAVELWTERGFERGIEETTVEEIARAAGVTKGTFYFHFAHKEDILFEMGWDTAAAMYAEAEKGIAAGQPPQQIMDAVLSSLGRRVEKVPKVAVLRSVHEFGRRPAEERDSNADHFGFKKAFETLLVYAQEQGELPKKVDTDDLAGVLHALTTDALETWAQGHRPSLGDLLRHRVDLVIAGATVLADEAAAGPRRARARRI